MNGYDYIKSKGVKSNSLKSRLRRGTGAHFFVPLILTSIAGESGIERSTMAATCPKRCCNPKGIYHVPPLRERTAFS
jgi:hypothetical protein